MRGPSERQRTAATIVALLAIVVASLWLRWPGFSQGGFASHDVAGILYNAMVLHDGGLPYVDTLEVKAPGTFFLARLFAGAEGRDIARFQIWANLWALAGLVMVAALGWRLWGRIGALVSAGLYALHDAHLDTMDANYVTWANGAQIGAFVLGIEASRARKTGNRAALWLLAGGVAGFAALCKRPDGVILLVILVIAAVAGLRANEDRSARPWGCWRAPALVLGGFVAAHLPIAALYARQGQLSALYHGYVFNSWGARYLGARGLSPDNLIEGALALTHFLSLPLCLAAFAGAAALLARREQAFDRARLEFAFVAVWAAGTLAAASIGFRFYKGYFVAVAAPTCLLAGASLGLLGRRSAAHWLPRILALALCLPLVGRELLILDKERVNRAVAHDLGGRTIAAHLIEHTHPRDTIWVWGWHLWDVYPMTGRMSASRIYKSLGILSQPNDDTWRRPASPLRFVESAYSDQLLAELDAARPAYVVLGSTVPHREFEALHAWLRQHYRRDRRVRIGRVEFWRRVD
ncbi:MAG: hypothetical protein KC457_06605 [Myxococcales bacterium]|nr:hypothetical protein [Myxococcales bacterium]